MKLKLLIAKIEKSIKYSIANITPLSIAKFLIMLVAVANMIWMPIYTDAILLLEDLICGFVLFCYILTGLIALFGVMRMDGKKKAKSVFTIAALTATITFGMMLYNTLVYALYYQTSLRNYEPVVNAINFNLLMCSLYGVCIVAVLSVHLLKVVKAKKAK